MAPILSTHPNPDVSGWAEIKALADRYNVTGKLVIKGGSIVSCLAVAHEVFGDEIDAYIVDVSDSTRDAVTELDALGFPYEYHESSRGHLWRNWRQYLLLFAPRLFR